jgi:hypothetical protein
VNNLFRAFCISLLIHGFGFATEPVSLTNREGRTLQARIVQSHGDSVQIQLMDGRLFTIGLDSLNEESQTTVRNWQAQRLVDTGIFQMSINRRNIESDANRHASTRIRNSRLQHIITLTHNRAQEFPKLEVRYMLFHFSPRLAAQDRNEGTQTIFRGTTTLENIGQFGSGTFEMPPVDMRVHQLAANVRYVSGGSRTARDRIDGIWVRIYENGLLIGEVQQPGVYFRNLEWDNEIARARAFP